MTVIMAEPAVRRPLALSPSRASDFKSCPLLYRLRAIDRLPEQFREIINQIPVVISDQVNIWREIEGDGAGLPPAAAVAPIDADLATPQWVFGMSRYVELADTIRSFREVVDGKHDDLPEQAFYMVGNIDEAVEKAKQIRSAS